MLAVFNTQDERMHKTIKSPIAPLYSLSNVVMFEGLVEGVLSCLADQLDKRFAGTGLTFDLGEWLQYFAFDVMGTMSFSKRYGFLESGEDVEGMLEAISKFMETAAPMTQITWLDPLLYKNKIVHSLRRTPGMTILGFVFKTIRQRLESPVTIIDQSNDDSKPEKDFLARFLEIQKANPEIPPCWYGYAYRNLWSEVRDLPYLDACVQESLRIHPPFALPLERVVPRGGVTVLGRYLPEGTMVGGNPYVVNRHESTFGANAEDWVPERWLSGDKGHKKKLEQSLLTIQIIDPKALEVENGFFLKQRGFYCKIDKRSQ
ncbi:hypothetical protein VPNG_08651 [Cytospora leucostoma]|uniref:Cytochrome P450 n=1 Tax=Cytospora leucostoma TaxID=1230097 RepID=A0A423W3B4_9PEZI|nr:hypothetical protein VPNG_08651 [Cytospora leucostoma]